MSDPVRATEGGIPRATEGGIPPAAVPPAAEGPVRALAADLRAKFSIPESAIKVQRATRLWVDVDRGLFEQVFDFLVKGAGFSILCTITGLDLGEDLGLIYHLARDGGIMANVKTRVPKGQSMRTVTPWFPGAAIYESEVEDLLGARFDGKPEMPRYPLPEDWPQGDHPLLKNWKSKGESPAPASPASSKEGAAQNA